MAVAAVAPGDREPVAPGVRDADLDRPSSARTTSPALKKYGHARSPLRTICAW
jgi:hypothetical protein